MSIPNEHPVIQLIRNRKREGSLPKKRSDDFKLGLALEGGGMRGVVGASMATALHCLGLVGVFDAVYGSSAGALAGSLFVTQNMPIGPTIYFDDLVSKDFIDLKYFFGGKKSVMHLDFLTETILQGRKPLNWKALLEGDIPLKIVVSSVNKRKALCIDDYKTKEELFTLLKASATVPFIAGPPVKYHDDLFFDAALYESIPYISAKNDGCTHILVLLTRPYGIIRAEPSIIDKVLIAPKMKKLNPGLEIDYLKRDIPYNSSLEELYSKNMEIVHLPVINDPSIFSFNLPKGTKTIGGLVKDRQKLIDGAKSGMKAVMDIFLKDEEIRYQEVLLPFNKYGINPKL